MEYGEQVEEKLFRGTALIEVWGSSLKNVLCLSLVEFFS